MILSVGARMFVFSISDWFRTLICQRLSNKFGVENLLQLHFCHTAHLLSPVWRSLLHLLYLQTGGTDLEISPQFPSRKNPLFFIYVLFLGVFLTKTPTFSLNFVR